MAFSKFANARIIKADINTPIWDQVRDSAQALGSAFATREASKIALTSYNPKDYMLSHCTIVASVDTEDGPGPLGRSIEGGYTIDRQFSDYLIKPQCSPFVNNNHDSWERKLLLSSFRTFVGGENYVEHLQIPEMSKGKILDAAARDIGDSVYIDILVATHRKHKPLIAAIESRRLQTLSMGCFLPGTQVSLADGRRISIEDVVPGEMVVTHKGRTREVLNQQIRKGRWDLRTVKAVGLPAPITSTGNHPYFVIRPSTECACGCGEPLVTQDRDPVRRLQKRFKRGHDKRLFNPNGTYSLEELRQRKSRLSEIQKLTPVEVRADELKVGDLLCVPRVREQGSLVSLGKARLLGYFLAEGSFLKRKGEPVEVQFNFALDEKDTLVAETVRLLGEEFPDANPAWVQDREDRNTSTVHISGKEVAAWFYRHGGEYSHLKRISPEAMSWSEEAHRELLQAWLLGDGGPQAQEGWTGLTTSYDLACQLHHLFSRCGVHVRFEARLDAHMVPVQQAVNGGVAVRGESGKLSSFSLCVPKSQKSLLGFTGSDRQQHLRVTEDYVLRPITSIEASSMEGWVYDLEVEEDHSYVVDGVAVHNCNVAFTVCTKCGNVAKDETELCPHIKYAKGNTFIDHLGRTLKVAELCGHVSTEPGSVKFIEASWVANPAFVGAVLRNVLTPEEAAVYNRIHAPKVQVAFNQPTRTADPSQMARAARSVPAHGFNLDDHKVAFDLGQGDQGGQQQEFPGAGGDTKEEDEDPMDKAVKDIANYIRDTAVNQVRQQLGPKSENNLDENRNDTIIQQASIKPSWQRLALTLNRATNDPNKTRRLLAGLSLYQKGGWRSVREAKVFSGQEVLAISKVLDALHGVPKVAGESRIYRTVLAVGGSEPYGDVDTYLAACRRVLGRELTETEKVALIVKGKLFDLGA